MFTNIFYFNFAILSCISLIIVINKEHVSFSWDTWQDCFKLCLYVNHPPVERRLGGVGQGYLGLCLWHYRKYFRLYMFGFLNICLFKATLCYNFNDKSSPIWKGCQPFLTLYNQTKIIVLFLVLLNLMEWENYFLYSYATLKSKVFD